MAKILIVDDNETNRRGLALNFTSRSYEVRIADDGEEARRILIEENDLPDYLLTDEEMPILSGSRLLDIVYNERMIGTIKCGLMSSVYSGGGVEKRLKEYVEQLGAKFFNKNDPNFLDLIFEYFK